MALKSRLTRAELPKCGYSHPGLVICLNGVIMFLSTFYSNLLLSPRQRCLRRDSLSLVKMLLALLFNTPRCPQIERSFILRIQFPSLLNLAWTSEGLQKIICHCTRVFFSFFAGGNVVSLYVINITTVSKRPDFVTCLFIYLFLFCPIYSRVKNILMKQNQQKVLDSFVYINHCQLLLLVFVTTQSAAGVKGATTQEIQQKCTGSNARQRPTPKIQDKEPSK